MDSELLLLLEKHTGPIICYTGGRNSGKTTYATLLAIYLNRFVGRAITTIDFSKDNSLSGNSIDLQVQTLALPKDFTLSGWCDQDAYFSPGDLLIVELSLDREHLTQVFHSTGTLQPVAVGDNAHFKNCIARLLNCMTQTLFILPDDGRGVEKAVKFLLDYTSFENRSKLGFFRTHTQDKGMLKDLPLDCKALGMSEVATMVVDKAEHLDFIASVSRDEYVDVFDHQMGQHFESYLNKLHDVTQFDYNTT